MHHSPLFNHLFRYQVLAWDSSSHHEDGVSYQGVASAPVLGWDVLGKTRRCRRVSWKTARPKELPSHREAEQSGCVDQPGSVAPTGYLPMANYYLLEGFTDQIFSQHWVLAKKWVSDSEATPLCLYRHMTQIILNSRLWLSDLGSFPCPPWQAQNKGVEPEARGSSFVSVSFQLYDLSKSQILIFRWG